MHVAGTYVAEASTFSTFETNGDRVIEIGFTLETGELVRKRMYLGCKVDKGGKTSTERAFEFLVDMGWDEKTDLVACLKGRKTRVKTQINSKGYPEVTFIDKPKASYSDEDWPATMAVLRKGLQVKTHVASPIVDWNATDKDLPF